jgi:hypothetical protein
VIEVSAVCKERYPNLGTRPAPTHPTSDAASAHSFGLREPGSLIGRSCSERRGVCKRRWIYDVGQRFTQRSVHTGAMRRHQR